MTPFILILGMMMIVVGMSPHQEANLPQKHPNAQEAKEHEPPPLKPREALLDDSETVGL